jgi:predicted dehydrogenase
LRIAFFGVGERAEPYLRCLARRRGIELVGVCDSDRRAAEEVAAGWGARVYADFTSMIAECEPEALWICVGPAHQGEIVLECAQRRLPFFAVPPGCSDFERARACVRVLRGQDLVTAVGFPARHTDLVRDAREFLNEKPVPLMVGSWVKPAEEGERSAVQVLWAEAAPLVDALRLFAGEVRTVSAVAGGEASKALNVQLQFASGTAGSLTCASLSNPQPRVELEVTGEDCSLILGDEFGTLRLEEQDKTTILRRLNNPADDVAGAFLQAVEERDPSAVQPAFADALRTLAVCRAAAISLEEKRIVPMEELGIE